MTRRWGVLATMGLGFLLGGCEPQSAEDVLTYPFAADQAEFSNADLRYVAYEPAYAPPAGFYADAYHPLYYENTVSIGQSEEGWRELCTDDYAQAKAWIDSHTNPENLGEREDPKFFEFKRTPSGFTNELYYRVHRCAYLDVYVYDHFNRTPERGTFNLRPLTTEAVEYLGEYLWYQRWHDIGGSKVLSSFAGETPEAYEHSLYYVGVLYGDWGLCDHISLTRALTSVDKTTGAIVATAETLRVIEGHCR